MINMKTMISKENMDDKRYWETKRQNIRKREKVMEDTIARYERELEELEKSRKEILKKAKEDAEHLLEESNAKIENTIRTIKEAQAEKERAGWRWSLGSKRA